MILSTQVVIKKVGPMEGKALHKTVDATLLTIDFTTVQHFFDFILTHFKPG